jgi:hypothetical protein
MDSIAAEISASTVVRDFPGAACPHLKFHYCQRVHRPRRRNRQVDHEREWLRTQADIRRGLKYSPRTQNRFTRSSHRAGGPGGTSAKKMAGESVDAGTALRPSDGIVGQRCLLAAHRSGGPVTETFLVGVAVLRDDGRDPLGVADGFEASGQDRRLPILVGRRRGCIATSL